MKIILNDGTEIKNTMAGRVDNRLELTMSKEDAVSNFSKFMDSEVMSKVEYYSGVWKVEYVGFNRFSHMENPKANEMRVWFEAVDQYSVSDPIQLVDDMYMPKGM